MDGRILGEQGAAVASAKRIRLWIRLLPLLRRQFRLHRIEVTQPGLDVEKDPGGRLNVEKLKRAARLLSALDGARLSISDGTLRYADMSSGNEIEVTGVTVIVSRLHFTDGNGPWIPKDLSVEAELACAEFRTKKLSVADVKVSVEGRDGVLELEPVTMRIFGGQMAGDIRADFSGQVPLWQVRSSLPEFRVEEFLRTLSPEKSTEGAMDFSATLSMQGSTTGQMVRSAMGEVSLRGHDLTLAGNDLDRTISRFESSQSFNLVDVGAVFFAGPLGLAVTRGYSFAGLFRGSGGRSAIALLVSDWTVERGVARAKDVALATTANRIALQGGLDFVNGQFDDVTVAVIDANGCATVRQVIRGPFGEPEVEKPRILRSLAGPVLKLYRQTRGLFPAGPCEVFYSGSVAHPE
jgi:AsmA protein